MSTALVVLWASLAPLGVYAWPHATGDESLAARFAAPAGAARVAVPDDSFAAFLRALPLLPVGAPVRLYDGTLKPRQDVHAAVVDLDVAPRDLQQCADAVMRLWAEYRYARRLPVVVHPDPGAPRALRFDGPYGDRRAFDRYLVRVFAEAGTASLAAELAPVRGAVAPGDVLVQGGHPGHAVLVLDVAAGTDGRRWLLLGQSYMPAQQFHVLRDPASGSPWFDAAALTAPAGLATPEWRPFHARDLRRF
jgi:hypothetical protein